MKSFPIIVLCLVTSLAQAHQHRPGKAAVASAHYLASEAGIEVMNNGGNAFDAAIAVSAALAVVEPASSGIGGGAFWLLYLAGEDRYVFVDGREMAPAAAHRDMYLNQDGSVNRRLAVTGPLSAAIPGEPAGLVHLAKHYGRLPLTESLAPAIRLASEGFPVDEKYRHILGGRDRYKSLSPAAAEVLLVDGEIPPLGHIIKIPDLAETLRLIANQGFEGFYRGPLADKMVKGVRDAGGIWTHEDLTNYVVKEREPIVIEYHDYKLITAPPPSSGGIALAEMLNILEGYELDRLTEVQRIHLMTEAMRRAYRDRSLYLGDPDFFKVPTELLTDERYAAGLRAGIRLDRATDSDALPGVPVKGPERTDTSHFSLIDPDGNRVASTLTVNLGYGSAFMAPGTGFLLNDEMDDFSAKAGVPNAYGLIGADANAIEPGKRPLSSMTPTIVEGPDRVAMLGTPGGSRIITMVFLGVLDFINGNPPTSWVSLPRLHHQYVPDRISAEPDALSADQVRELEALGHEVRVENRTWGNMHGVMWDRRAGEVSAGSDPRWASGRAIVSEVESTYQPARAAGQN